MGERGTAVHRCDQCDYDICSACFTGRTSSDNTGATVQSDNAAAVGSTKYAVCLDGTKCKQRSDEDHIAGFAHPFDFEYEYLCRKCSVQDEAEERTLMGLFRWLDADDSGKLTTEEIEEGLQLLSSLGEETIPSVKALDEDGNGSVNFSEFAQWAGPRLRLPLGVPKHRRQSTIMVEKCGVMGCPCEGFKAREVTQQKKRHTFWGGLWGESSGDHIQLCTCGHKKSLHHKSAEVILSEAVDLGNTFPEYWSNKSGSYFLERVPVSSEVVSQLQALVNHTYKKIWTRDRRKHNPDQPNVPSGYRVTRALRNENNKNWVSYQRRKAVALEHHEETESGPRAEDFQTDTLSSHWQNVGEGAAEILASHINEWYLFHGCRDWVAHKICDTDFHIGSAGKNTGTLYGGGTYLTESITKADEYAKPNDNGEYCFLLCRALGGRIRYTDEVTPDPEELTRACIEGPFDSVLGDRQKCRGTFREFVFYDAEDMYPEYVVYYTRN